MNAREVVVIVSLGLAVATILVSCTGLLARDTLDCLHFLGPVTVLAPWLIAIAVAARFSSAESAIKSALLPLVFLLSSPVLTHATAKTVHSWREDKRSRRKK